MRDDKHWDLIICPAITHPATSPTEFTKVIKSLCLLTVITALLLQISSGDPYNLIQFCQFKSVFLLIVLRQKYKCREERDHIWMISDVYQVFLASHPPFRGDGPLWPPPAIHCTSSTPLTNSKTTHKLINACHHSSQDRKTCCRAWSSWLKQHFMLFLGTDKQVLEKHTNECALTSGGRLVQEKQGLAGNALLLSSK